LEVQIVHALSARDIVQIWEWGQDKHPIDRALRLLALASPELTAEQLQGLTIGQRNSRLLALREQTLGPTLKGFAECTQCGTPLEFSVAAAAICHPEPVDRTYSIEMDDLEIRFRLLNSEDLASIVGLTDVDVARLRLIERCVVEAKQDGQSMKSSDLSETVLASLVDAVTERDPQAEIRFQLTCAACNHYWSVLFDIVSFFWTELSARAQRHLFEVHTLARAYGWREADILAMSETRRGFYLGWVG